MTADEQDRTDVTSMPEAAETAPDESARQTRDRETALPPQTAAAAPQPAPAPPTGRIRPRPRTGPIVWGALVLSFCAYIAIRSVSHGTVDTTAWVITTVIGLGVLLLAVGAAVLIRGSRERR